MAASLSVPAADLGDLDPVEAAKRIHIVFDEHRQRYVAQGRETVALAIHVWPQRRQHWLRPPVRT